MGLFNVPKVNPLFLRIFKIGISCACLYFIWQWIDTAGLVDKVKGLALTPFILAVIFNLIHKVLNAVKIRWLFPSPSPGLMELIKVNFIAVFFRTFLPGVVGGELARWAYLGQGKTSKSQAMAVILLDRMTGLWAQIFLAMAAWLWLSKNSITIWIAGPASLIVLVGSLWAGLWGYRSLSHALARLGIWYGRKQSQALEREDGISKALLDLLSTRGRFWKIATLSLISQILVVFTFLLIDRSAYGQLGLAQAMVLLFCYGLVLLLPVAFGNWGLSEGTLGLLYHYSGSSGAMGIAIALIIRLMDLPAILLGWIFFLRHRSRSA